MSDLISRQAVLDGIAEWIVNGYADSEADCSHISSLVTHLPSVENKGEWIPVSERLPKAFETVLRTRVENGWNGTTYTIVDTGCICPVDHNIVAWMPLPKPYNAESEDKE